MSNWPSKRKSSDDTNVDASYVSKEKYTALADEIRKWEDDLWHTRRQASRSRASSSTDKTPERRGQARESLASVTPAHVSVMRKFWEGLMTDEVLNELPKRQPLQHLQLPSLSSKRNNVSALVESSACDENVMTKCSDLESPELPPPPAGGSEDPLIMSDLPPPPFPHAEGDVHSKSADFIDLSDSPNRECLIPEGPSTVQPLVSHRYYNRPRLGARPNSNGGAFYRGVLRNWPNSSNLSESPSTAVDEKKKNAELPRQRSVTFQPKPDSVPGDTEVEETEAELPTMNSTTSSSFSPNSDGFEERYKYVDGETFGALECAARLANSADRFDRSHRRSRRSSLIAVPALDINEVNSNDSSRSLSDDDSDDKDSVNSEPISGRPSLTVGIVSPASSRGRKSSDGSKRISREASALLDFDCPPRGGQLSRSNTEIESLEAVTLRRLERMRDIADLITREKSVIMDLSTELSELHTATTGKTSKSGAPVVVISETTLVDLNLRFLLACQRRQALMEELSLLHNGSRVLVPPMHGEPLRARLQLHTVRVALKPDSSLLFGGSGGGFAVVGMGEKSRSLSSSRPMKYHILAVLKCVGEGRIYHTQTVTLVRVADLPSGTARPVSFVDLPADFDIIPLRPDFVVNIEVYCLQTGGGGGCGVVSSDRNRLSGLLTPVSKRINLSVVERSPTISSAKKCSGFHMPSLLLSSKKKKKHNFSKQSQNIDLSAAFTFLSSVSLRHHDDLLFGRLPRWRCESGDAGEMALVATDNQEAAGVVGSNRGDRVEMPLYLEGLPRSSPLAGPLGLNGIAVRLQSAVLKRGFLTVFDESGGMGVWTRCWCKLSVDQLIYWRYPEDEMEAAVVSASSTAVPIGRLDLRRIVAPWAVAAPRKICMRANTIYMRSLVAANPKLLPLDATPSAATSILLHASSDYKWMEQRHLICADSAVEMESWLKQLNRALEVLQRWMPEHFSRLLSYDSGLTFTQPVAASVASRLKRC